MKIRFSVRQIFAVISLTAVACGIGTTIGMETLGMMLVIWAVYSGIVIATVGPIALLTRKRLRWFWWESSVLFVPYLAWFGLMMTEIASKSLSNLVEPFYFAFAAPIAATLRAVAARWLPNKACAVGFIVIVCGAAIATYFLVPGLPE